MKKIILVIVISAFPFIAFSQLSVNITVDKSPIYPQDGDTLSVCRDTLITFEAIVDLGGLPVTGANYFWDFDDGTQLNGIDLDSITHIYSKGGGYRVSLYVIDASSNKSYDILPVKIDLPSNFSMTKADIPDGQNGICKGSSIFLKGIAFPEVWEEKFVSSVTESSGILFNDTKIYQSTISFNEFPVGATFSDGNIDSVLINMEHSDMGNVQIKIICPEGNSVILKDTITLNHSYLGIPIDDDASTIAGTGYDYFFSTGALPGIMNSDFTPTLPSQAYSPEEPYTNLNGCSLNGVWKIEVTDNTPLDNGFIFSWGIIFKDSIIPHDWAFTDTLKSNYTYTDGSIAGTYWNGANITGTGIVFNGDTINGTCSATPPVYGNNGYTFYTVNNWGCPKDTAIAVKVEPASFTASPETGPAKLDVSFSNTTSWGKTFVWTFGDDTTGDNLASVSHEYQEKGTYYSILKVSDANSCFDIDTVTIEVTVEPSVLAQIPNAFTPNNDGINDLFKFNVSGMYSFSLKIYNRWGELIYKTTDQDIISETGWDGRDSFTNLRVSPGTYFYIVSAIGKDLEKYSEKGSIHVFR